MKTRRQRNTEPGLISRPTLMLILAGLIALWGVVMVAL